MRKSYVSPAVTVIGVEGGSRKYICATEGLVLEIRVASSFQDVGGGRDADNTDVVVVVATA
jgi:hypothetical protein